VAGGAEGDPLAGDRRIGLLVVVGTDEGVDVDERLRVRQAAG
jgi:hypothetical protein